MATSLIQPHFVQNSKKAEQYFPSHAVSVPWNGKKISVAAPKNWSDLAVQMAFDKYMRKNDVPQTKMEKSVFSMVDRVVQSIADCGVEKKYFDKKQRTQFENELKYILLSQRACFNSPVWFNVGLSSSYRIRSDHSNYSWNENQNKVEKNSNGYAKPQSSACFIQSISDDMDSIFNLIKSEAMLFKYGSGSGTNFSALRSKNSQISTGENSSGLISFLEIFDKSAGVIKSGGTTRRAAKMVCLDVSHPEIFEFVNWKMKEEFKAGILLKNGFSGGINGEATRSVSGQNSNNSVRVTNSFLEAVLKNKTWNLKEKNTSSSGNQKVQAKELWNQICKAAWTCADPGIQFHDEINQWNTCQSETIHASNPCSEFMFLDDTACNLASVNLAHFLNDQNEFLINDFLQTVKVLILAQDILVSLSGYPTEKIAERSFHYRPLGIGISNLATFFLKKILPYDSQEARDWAAYICALLTGSAYLQSSEIARHFTSGKKNGSFLAFSKNKKSMIQVLKSHQKHLKFLNASVIPSELLKATENIWKKTLEQTQKTGVRNAQISALAPTGTISFIMDCETTGIEPEFSWLKTKALADGGSIQSINQTMKRTLIHLGYTDEEITLLIQHLHKHNTLSGCQILDPKHRFIFQTALDQNPEMCLSKESHLKMMAACQPFISGAISKTVNLPKSTTVEEISEIYLLAWKLKLKSVAVYRDQSKLFQPLTQNVDELNCMECA